MKIRITGKGLPKAQWAGQQGSTQLGAQSNVPTTLLYNGQLISPNDPRYQPLLNQSSQSLNTAREKFKLPNYNKINTLKSLAPKLPTLSFKPFANSGQAAASINPFTQTATTVPAIVNQQPTVTTVQPATTATTTSAPEPARRWHSEWDDEGFDTDPASPLNQNAQQSTQSAATTNSPSKLAKAAGWYSKNIGQPVENAFEGMDKLISWGNLGTQLVNGYKKKKDFDKFMRRQTSTDSLFPEVPDEMSGNRGDYVVSGSRFGEFRPDEYVVNKGMYTGQFLPRMAQYGGGVIPEALTMPIDMVELSTPLQNPLASGDVYGGSDNTNRTPATSGANPIAEQTWQEVSSQFQGVKNLGIWGDEAHKKTVSDHNTGDALDIGILGVDQGTQIAQKLINEAQNKNIKYIIWNKQIWNPSISNSWRPYDGKNPHTDHVHVSFNRGSGGTENTDEVALSHNNPLNIHYGDFASKYGATQGAKDSNGFVGKFPDLNTGIQAGKDLLFGPNYANLSISQARNQWVSGNPNTPNASTSDIVKNMGGDKKISDLSPAEKDKLFKLFSKWEGGKAYNKIKGMNLFAEGGTISQYETGGVYELTEDQIKHILASGGEVEFL